MGPSYFNTYIKPELVRRFSCPFLQFSPTHPKLHLPLSPKFINTPLSCELSIMSAYNKINYFHLQTLVKQRHLDHNGKSQEVLITALEKEDRDGRNYEQWDRSLLKKEMRTRGLGNAGHLSVQAIAQKLRVDDGSKDRYEPCPPFREEDEEDEENDPDLDSDQEGDDDGEDDEDGDDDGNNGDDDGDRNGSTVRTEGTTLQVSEDEQQHPVSSVTAERRLQKIESNPRWPGSRDVSQSTVPSDTSSVFSEAPRSATGATPATEETTGALRSKRLASHSPSVRSDESGQPHRQKRFGTSDDQHSVMSLDEVFHPDYQNRKIDPQGDIKPQQAQNQSSRDTSSDTSREGNESSVTSKEKDAIARVKAIFKSKTAPSDGNAVAEQHEVSQESHQSHKYMEMTKAQLTEEVIKRNLPIPHQSLSDDAWVQLLNIVLRVDDFHRQENGREPTSGMSPKPGMSSVSETEDLAHKAEGLPRNHNSEEPGRPRDDSQAGLLFDWRRYFSENPVKTNYDPNDPCTENPNRPKEGWAPFGPFENAKERWVIIIHPETHQKLEAHIHSLSRKDQLIVEFSGMSTKRQSRGAILPANEVFLEERESFKSWCKDNHHQEKLLGNIEDLEALTFEIHFDKDSSIVCSLLSPKAGGLKVADALIILRLKNVQLEKHRNASGKVYTRTALERRFGHSMKLWILGNRVDRDLAKQIMVKRQAYKKHMASAPVG